MKILGIDTSTGYLSLAIYDDGAVYECNIEAGRRLSALLAPFMQKALEASSVSIRDIDYFACGLGPGSFTGMRIGIAAIKGLAWAGKKPAVGISSLDIIARNVKDTDHDIVTAVDAKRGLVYCCIYRSKKGAFKRVSPYMLLAKEQLIKKISPGSVLLGDAAGLYKEFFLSYVKNAVLLDKDYWYPKAYNIIELALAGIKVKEISDSFGLKPIYLYPDACQVKKRVLRSS